MESSEEKETSLTFDEVPSRDRYDGIVVGSGPNGFAAAITLARHGHRVLLIEAKPTIGGGMRSAQWTLPGFTHDVCSAIHAFAAISPFFQSVPLDQFGLQWVWPDAPVAHPLEDGTVAMGERSVEATAEGLGADAGAYEQLFGPLVRNSEKLFQQSLRPPRLPRNPILMAKFGLLAIRSAASLAKHRFATEAARALFAGHAAHSVLPLEQRLSAAVGLMLTISSHSGGWPVARGGSQSIADAMARYLLHMGGEIVVNRPVQNLQELPDAKVVLFDTSPHGLDAIVGDRFPDRYRRQLQRFRYGPAAFKVDWALSGPIPWRASECLRAGTVHVGGSLDTIAASERAAWSDVPAEQPFVLVAQQSLFDPTRAPPGKQVAWGYCHVPNGCTQDMTERIESQIEAYAPGFRDRILARHTMAPAELHAYNANYVGGDISSGVMDIRQFIARPALRPTPYRTPLEHLFLCSASTPPGPGVHGMAGYHAATYALEKL